jgi:hypothetical protein
MIHREMAFHSYAQCLCQLRLNLSLSTHFQSGSIFIVAIYLSKKGLSLELASSVCVTSMAIST